MLQLGPLSDYAASRPFTLQLWVEQLCGLGKAT